MKCISLYRLFILVILTLPSCSPNQDVPIISDSVVENQSPDDGKLVLSARQFKASGMDLGKIKNMDFYQLVKANGTFDVAPKNRASVSSYFQGTVVSIQLLPGQWVKKGQTLFVLENPEYIQMQQDYLEAKTQLKYLESDFKRQKNLFEDKVSSEKNYLKAESDFSLTRIKLEALGKKLRLMNIDPEKLTMDNVRSKINIASPITGYVSKVNITQGSFLNSAQVAVTIVDTSHLHLELNVFESDLSKITKGQNIRFRIQEDEDNEYDASVYLINKNIDPETHTIQIHGELADDLNSSRFTPGMYVEAFIYIDSNSTPSLPQEAIAELDGNTYVLELENFSDSTYVFVKKDVMIGESFEGFVEIVNPATFKEGTEFLVKGGFNLLIE